MAVRDGLSGAGMYAGYVPYFLLLDPEMRIDQTHQGSGPNFDARIDELLE